MNSLFEENPNAFSVDIKKQRLSQVYLRQPLSINSIKFLFTSLGSVATNSDYAATHL